MTCVLVLAVEFNDRNSPHEYIILHNTTIRRTLRAMITTRTVKMAHEDTTALEIDRHGTDNDGQPISQLRFITWHASIHSNMCLCACYGHSANELTFHALNSRTRNLYFRLTTRAQNSRVDIVTSGIYRPIVFISKLTFTSREEALELPLVDEIAGSATMNYNAIHRGWVIPLLCTGVCSGKHYHTGLCMARTFTCVYLIHIYLIFLKQICSIDCRL